MLCCIADGSDKVRPQLITRSKCPQCFRSQLKSGYYDNNPVTSEEQDIMYTFDEYLNAENNEQSDESPLLSKQQVYESIINPVEEDEEEEKEDEEENSESASKIPTKVETYHQLEYVFKYIESSSSFSEKDIKLINEIHECLVDLILLLYLFKYIYMLIKTNYP
jgi:hypothetical protein